MEGDTPISIYQRAVQQVFENKRSEQQAAQEKARLEEEKARRKQQDEQFKAQQKAADLKFKADQAQQEYANLGTYQKSGITPPGTELIPGLTPTEDQPLVLSGLEKDTLIGPSGSTYQVPPYAESPQQKLLRAQEIQKTNDQIRRDQFKRQQESEDNLLLEKERGKRLIESLGVKFNNDKQLEDIKQKGRVELEGMRNANAQSIARIKLKNADDSFANSPGASDVLNRVMMGTISQEEINRMPKAQKDSVYKMASENRGQILPKATTDRVQGIETLTQLIPTIDRMISLQYTDPVKVNVPFTDAGREFDRLKTQVRAASPQASVAFTGVRRFNNPELARFDEYFLAKKFYGTSDIKANMLNRNDFVKKLRMEVAQVLQGLSPEQQAAVKANLKDKGAFYLGDDPKVQPESSEEKPYDEMIIDHTGTFNHVGR